MSKDSGGLPVILRRAMSSGNVEEVIDLMDDSEFEPNERDTYHDLQTFLMKLCHVDLHHEEETAILEKLDEKDLDFTVRDAYGRTALIHACIGDRLGIVEFVTSRHPEVTERDNDGNNVLVYAVKNGNYGIIEQLLGCDRTSYALMSSQNNLGLTALDFARRTENNGIIKLLENHMPTHPSVKVLRRSQEKVPSGSCAPPVIPPACRSMSMGLRENNRTSSRVPFHHSKSWDIDDRLQKMPLGRAYHSVDLQQPQRTSHKDLRSSRNDENSIITVCGIQRQSHVGKYAKHNDVSRFPQIVPPHVQQDGTCDTKKGRRDSVSLPDLRNLTGSLVCPGGVNSRSGDKLALVSRESLTESDDVFESESEVDSSVVKLPVLLANNSRKPERSLPSLARARKRSNSAEDIAHKSVF